MWISRHRQSVAVRSSHTFLATLHVSAKQQWRGFTGFFEVGVGCLFWKSRPDPRRPARPQRLSKIVIDDLRASLPVLITYSANSRQNAAHSSASSRKLTHLGPASTSSSLGHSRPRYSRKIENSASTLGRCLRMKCLDLLQMSRHSDMPGCALCCIGGRAAAVRRLAWRSAVLAPPQLPKLLGARGCYRGHCGDADGGARLLGQHLRHEQPVILVLAWQSTTAGRARAVAGPAAKPAAGWAPPTPVSSR
jgi:hypothetical protein